MTVAVAVRKNGRTVLAADSLVNFGGQRFPPENCKFHKIHRVGDSFLVWAGWSLYAEMLNAHLERHPPPTLHTESDVFAFFIQFWRAIRKDYNFMQRGGAGDHPFADLESTFLLANRGGIFRVQSDLDVTEFKQYSAVGTGAKYALGAMRILYDQLEDPREIALRAAQVGVDSDVYCGGPIDLTEVTQAE
jgi:ATP-dependent protease HslVU (ClpYQ) peptidase subunit